MAEIDRENETLVELVDEEGRELKFVLEMKLDYEDETYVVLSPAVPLEDFAEDEALILKLTGEEDDPLLESVEDEELLDKLYDEYVRILDEEDMESEDESEDQDE